MDDHAVTDVPEMELSYMAQAQDALCLWQGDPHSQTDGQQLIAGRSGLLSVKDLVGVGLVQAGGGDDRSLTEPVAVKELGQGIAEGDLFELAFVLFKVRG